jgi:hypothetical protein
VIPTAIPVLGHDKLTTDNVIIKSGTIKNMEIAVRIILLSLTVQKLFIIPVSRVPC